MVVMLAVVVTAGVKSETAAPIRGAEMLDGVVIVGENNAALMESKAIGTTRLILRAFKLVVSPISGAVMSAVVVGTGLNNVVCTLMEGAVTFPLAVTVGNSVSARKSSILHAVEAPPALIPTFVPKVCDVSVVVAI